MPEFDKALHHLTEYLFTDHPHPVLLYASRYLIVEYDRNRIPDWVAAVANGNLDVWDAVVDEARRLKLAEDRMEE